MMIRCWEYGEKGVTDERTDRRTDGQMDWTSHIAVWSQLKIWRYNYWPLWISFKSVIAASPTVSSNEMSNDVKDSLLEDTMGFIDDFTEEATMWF